MLLMHQQICSRRPIQAPTGVFPPNESAGLSSGDAEIGWRPAPEKNIETMPFWGKK